VVCFYAWAKDYNPSVYIVQKDGSHYSFRKGFWNTLNSDLFVLGDSNHRYELLGDASNLTSNLMISKNDWENFDKHLIAEKTLNPCGLFLLKYIDCLFLVFLPLA